MPSSNFGYELDRDFCSFSLANLMIATPISPIGIIIAYFR